MKVNKNVFLDCLGQVLPAVDNKSLFDEYRRFNFCGQKVLATDGSIWIETPLPDGVMLEASVLAAPLFSLLKELPEGELDLRLENGKLSIKTDKLSSSFDAKVLGSSRPPSVGPVASVITGELLNDLIDGLNFCRHGVSKDENDGPLCGIKVGLNWVWSCDRYRILRWQLSQTFPSGFELCLPVRVVNLLVGNRSNLKHLTFLPRNNFGGILVIDLNNGSTIWATTLEGEYNDLNPFFPGNEVIGEEIELNMEFLGVLGRHLAILQDLPAEDKEVSFKVGNQSVVTSSKKFTVAGTGGPGVASERELTESYELSKVREGPDFEFLVNPVLLKDAFGLCCQTFKYYPEKSFVLFEGEKFKHLVKVKKI
jgi:hypothetical protein